MIEQYYYLLDGKEHGPFSRIAILKLLESGVIAGAVLRTSPDQVWLTKEEIGLVSPIDMQVRSGPENPEKPKQSLQIPSGLASSLCSSTEPSIKQKTSLKALLLILAIAGLGVVARHTLFRNDVADERTQAGQARNQALLNKAGESASTNKPVEEQIPIIASDVAQSSQLRQFHGRYVYGTNPDEGPFFVIYPSAAELSATPARGYDKLILDGFEALSIKNGFPDLSAIDTDCEIKGTATVSVSNIRLAQQQVYGEDQTTETVAKATVSRINSMSAPENLPNECRTASPDQSTSDSKSTREPPLDSGHLRFSDAAEVLELARRKQIDDWSTDAMRECSCSINGNVIELAADRRIVLYNDISGPSVIAYYWEDNRGNPYTHFYRYDGSWVDAGHDVMPGYTGNNNDNFEATSEGITKWQGEGTPPRKYVYRSGVFAVVR